MQRHKGCMYRYQILTIEAYLSATTMFCLLPLPLTEMRKSISLLSPIHTPIQGDWDWFATPVHNIRAIWSFTYNAVICLFQEKKKHCTHIQTLNLKHCDSPCLQGAGVHPAAGWHKAGHGHQGGCWQDHCKFQHKQRHKSINMNGFTSARKKPGPSHHHWTRTRWNGDWP